MGKKSKATKASTVIDPSVVPIDRDTLAKQHKMAACLYTMGQYIEAESIASKVVQQRESTLGSSDRDTLASVVLQSDCLHMLGRSNQAVPLLRRALADSERSRGLTDDASPEALTSLAFCLSQLGQYAEAVPLFNKLLAAVDQKDAHDEWIPYLCSELAHCLVSLRRHEEAVPQLEKLTRMFMSLQRDDIDDLHSCFYRLGACYTKLQRFHEALPAFKKALEMAQQIPSEGRRSQWVVQYKHDVGQTLMCLGRAREACGVFRDVATASSRVHGAKHPVTMHAERNIMASEMFVALQTQYARTHSGSVTVIQESGLPHGEIMNVTVSPASSTGLPGAAATPLEEPTRIYCCAILAVYPPAASGPRLAPRHLLNLASEQRDQASPQAACQATPPHEAQGQCGQPPTQASRQLPTHASRQPTQQAAAPETARCCSTCHISGVPLKLCSCRSVRYCSVTCQKEAWREHRRVCPARVLPPAG